MVDRGKYMHVSDGRKYYPLHPKAEEVSIEVIAHHLATRCRYNGAVQHKDVDWRMFYSVAEHSVYVALYLVLLGYSKREILTALLHDGSEAFNGDLIRPLKYSSEFSAPFKVVEERNERAIAEKFDLIFPYPAIVKEADEAVTSAEINQIVPQNSDEEWDSGKLHSEERRAPFDIKMLTPFDAKRMFMDLYNRIINDTYPKGIREISKFLEQYR